MMAPALAHTRLCTLHTVHCGRPHMYMWLEHCAAQVSYPSLLWSCAPELPLLPASHTRDVRRCSRCATSVRCVLVACGCACACDFCCKNVAIYSRGKKKPALRAGAGSALMSARGAKTKHLILEPLL